MKRKFLTLLTITTALLMWSCNAFAEGKVAPVTNNTTVMNGMAPDDITVCIDTKKVFEDIQKTFSKFYTADDLAKNLNIIKSSTQYVENVVFDANSGVMTVTLTDKTEKKFYNPLFAKSVRTDKAIKEYKAADNKRIGKTVWVGNGLHYDTEFAVRTQMLQDLAQRLCNIGFDVTYTPTWNDSLLLNSDIVLYHGHGVQTDYGRLHWINTGITNNNDTYRRPLGMEISEGKNSYCINEEYINSKKTLQNKATKLKSNAFVYLACCHLLDKNDNMAKVFTKKGAAAVVGYEDTASRTSIYGAAFLDQLAMGKNIGEAYDFLDKKVDGGLLSIFSADEQKKYAPGLDEANSFVAEAVVWSDLYKIVPHSKYSEYVYYHDIEGRKELTRLYNLLNGDSWDEASKKNWLSSLDISHWANVSYNLTTGGINVTIKDSKMNLPSDLTLENFKRIETISLPEGNTVTNMTVKDCQMMTIVTNLASNNLVISGCPKLKFINLKGAKNVTISDCNALGGLSTNNAPEVENLTITNCNSFSSFQALGNYKNPYASSDEKKTMLRSLTIKNCNKLYIHIGGCPLTGTLDLTEVGEALKSVMINDTDLREIKVGEKGVESLSISTSPIYQTYESIPGWEKHVNTLEAKFIYSNLGALYGHEEEGTRVGGTDEEPVFYFQQFKDGHGFYHKGEPEDPKYWHY